MCCITLRAFIRRVFAAGEESILRDVGFGQNRVRKRGVWKGTDALRLVT